MMIVGRIEALVKMARERARVRGSERSARESSFDKRWLKGRLSIFMRGVGIEYSANDLRKQFNFYGVIVDIHIPRFRDESRGFRFVRYKNEEYVEYLLKMNPEIIVGGRKVFFTRALKISIL